MLTTGRFTVIEDIEECLFLYLKTFILFYSNDTISLVESANDLLAIVNHGNLLCLLV